MEKHALIPKEGGGIRVFHLGQYVVRRGAMGRLLEVVLRECYDYQGLPKEIQALATPGRVTTGLADDEKVDGRISGPQPGLPRLGYLSRGG